MASGPALEGTRFAVENPTALFDEDKGFLRVVVAGGKVVSPYRLIESFNLNVYQVVFDGHVFTLP